MKGVLASVCQALPLVLVALVVFQTLRTYWLERYVVTSGSMEPLLHGHPIDGDRVLVDKSVASSWTPARGDLVVMRDREAPGAYVVKRVAARGGERVRLMGGDLFIWDAGLRDWRRWEKDPLEFRDMRMAFFEHPGEGEEPVEGYLHGLEDPAPGPGQAFLLPAAGRDLGSLRQLLTSEAREKRLRERPADYHLPGHLGTAQAVDTRFLDSKGVLRGEALLCQDIGLEVDLVAEAGLVGLQLVFEYHGKYYAWSYHADGGVQFHRGSEPLGDPVNAKPLRVGQLLRIEFGYLDGHFFLIAGDRLAGRWKLDLPFGDPAPPSGLGTVPNNLLHLGAAGAPVRVARVRVFHDVYYLTPPRPFHPGDVDVPLGELWLLGDNTFDSRDSRSRGGFPRGDLVGRPIAILGPLARFRVLPR